MTGTGYMRLRKSKLVGCQNGKSPIVSTISVRYEVVTKCDRTARLCLMASRILILASVSASPLSLAAARVVRSVTISTGTSVSGGKLSHGSRPLSKHHRTTSHAFMLISKGTSWMWFTASMTSGISLLASASLIAARWSAFMPRTRCTLRERSSGYGPPW